MSTRAPKIYATLLLLPAIVMCGCSDFEEPAPTRARNEGWSTIRMPFITRDAAYDAGLKAMQQWFKIAEASKVDGQIRSVTTEYEQKGGTGRIRDAALGFKNRMRRTATIYVEGEGQGSVARCVVEVQRLDTAEYRTFQDNDRFDDTANQTPIDRDASVRTTKDQVWTDMPHDRQLEGDILSVLRAKATSAQPTTASAPAAE